VVRLDHPGDRATVEAGFAAANVSIQYPREFFLADLLQELQKWANAIKMDLGLTFEHYIKNRVVDELAPELPTALRETIKNEIEGRSRTATRDGRGAGAFGARSRRSPPRDKTPVPPAAAGMGQGAAPAGGEGQRRPGTEGAAA
jgi:hypothetical protein